MKQTPWFTRKFSRITDPGLFQGMVVRLEGTPTRLAAYLRDQPDEANRPNDQQWSLKKQIGHLIDLEPLWYGRCQQIIAGEKDLLEADLTNQLTHKTAHDEVDFRTLVTEFSDRRARLIAMLREVTEDQLQNTAIHPRLRTPMTLMDLTFFVAEHDDHHLVKVTNFLRDI